jgi:hypothetical protein
LESLDNIYDQIRQKITKYYELMAEKQKNNIKDYNILMDYNKKLDYVISTQNYLINEFEQMNKELDNNLNNDKDNENLKDADDDEINKNIEVANKNFEEMENIIKENYIKDYDINNLNNLINSNLNMNNFNENDNFFDVMNRLYEPIKEINKAYQQIMLECAEFGEE